MGNIKLLCVVILTSLVAIVTGYPNFPNRIPNGNRVPHPCKPNYVWYGVGHLNSKGGGARNKFGAAFKEWGYEWNACLCKEDSDGDGKTNGEELGDPDCIWKPGQIPSRTTGITHPGICDPFYGAECAGKNDWVDCSSNSNFKCDALKQPGVKNFTIRIDKTKVPPKETTYLCQAFNLTNMLPAGDSHLIGTTPSIDNKNVMHHAIIYACPDNNAGKVMNEFGKPVHCGMGTIYCRDMIALWTVGIDGLCINDQIGFAMGKKGYKTVLMEFHWNNPDGINDYYDSSGITMYVQPNLRQYDAGVWFIGPPMVYIPPKYAEYSNFGGCSSACTSLMLKETIYITRIVPHMHYLGTAFRLQHYRNGMKTYELEVLPYMYDDPSEEILANPLEVRPGDQLNIECVFQSRDKTEPTFYGESTSAEMCFGILMYYPYTKGLTACMTNQGYGFCNDTAYPNPFKDYNGTSGCDISSFNLLAIADGESIAQSCDATGLKCLPSCKQAISRMVSHPCWTGKAKSILMAYYQNDDNGRPLLIMLGSCDERPPLIVDGNSNSGKCNILPPVASSQKLIAGFGAILMIVLANVLLL